MGFAERQPSIDPSLPIAAVERLAAIQAQVDPSGMITANRINDATAHTTEPPVCGDAEGSTWQPQSGLARAR
jgi:hypothetical protein